MFAMAREQALGVELDRQQKRQQLPVVRRQLQTLDNSIYTSGIHTQRFSDFFHRLVMGAVHPKPGSV